MMNVEQVKDAIRNGHTVAATHDVVIAAYSGLLDEVNDECAWRKQAMIDARDALACSNIKAAWDALDRHHKVSA